MVTDNWSPLYDLNLYNNKQQDITQTIFITIYEQNLLNTYMHTFIL